MSPQLARSWTTASFRPPHRPTAAPPATLHLQPAAPPPPPAPPLPPPLHHLLPHLLRSAPSTDEALPALAAAAAAHAYALPRLARREGGLWLLAPPRLLQLRAAAPAARLAAPYAPPRPPPPAVPSVDFATEWAARGARLLAEGACCTLRRCALFPPGLRHWGRRAYLEAQLAAAPCHVLESAARRFCYWTDLASPASDRVSAGYPFRAPVASRVLAARDFFARSDAREGVYLQHSLLLPREGGGMAPTAGVGEQMAAELRDGVDAAVLRAIAGAGAFGPLARVQLFVGTRAAEGARTNLHFDQYDNIFLQLSGSKTFVLFPPSQTGNLYQYPIHHALDRSCQVDLLRADTERFPRSAPTRLKGCTVTVRPGDVLFLPAYWWHEVITEPLRSDEEMTVSLNFWFSTARMLFSPELPLRPAVRVELSRQLEFLIADALADRAHYVPAFFKGMTAQLNAIAAEGGGGRTTDGEQGEAWQAHLAARPADVEPWEWLGLFEFIVARLILMLGAHQVKDFVDDLCSPDRFVALHSPQYNNPI